MKFYITLLSLVSLTASGFQLVEYDFQPVPTVSQVDADFVFSGVEVSDISEFGDPDQSGDAALGNFTGATLVLKRQGLADGPLDDFNDYLTFTINATSTNEQLDLSEFGVVFGSVDGQSDFELGLFVDTGDGFYQIGSSLFSDAFDSDVVDFDLSGVSNVTSSVFRLGFRNDNPTNANHSLRIENISVKGMVIPEPSKFALFLGGGALMLTMLRRRLF